MTVSFPCQRVGCHRHGTARSTWEAARRQYCSRRCVGIASANLTAAGRVKGQAASRVVRRAQALAKLRGMTARQIFKMAFTRGWHAGVRRERSRTLDL